MENYLVSIIVPNYNHKKFLEQRFISILNQCIKNYEIIFLDDASTDGSVKLVKEKFYNYINYFDINKVNTGNPFMQWNKGVNVSRGKYIWIAESDDYCEPDFLEKGLNLLELNPKTGLVYCKSVPIDSQNKILDSEFYEKYVSCLDTTLWKNDFVINGYSAVQKYLSHKNIITNVSGVIFRRSAYIAAGYAEEKMSMCGDWMTYCRILHDWDIGYISKTLNYHRQHSNNHTLRSVINLIYFHEFIKVNDYIKQKFHLSKEYKKVSYKIILEECYRLTTHKNISFKLIDIFRLSWMIAKAYPGGSSYHGIAKYVLYYVFKKLRHKWHES